MEGWQEVIVSGMPLWRHTSGAQIYESPFWRKERDRMARCYPEEAKHYYTWRAQRVSDVSDGGDDGYLYKTREEAMEAALRGEETDD